MALAVSNRVQDRHESRMRANVEQGRAWAILELRRHTRLQH
jgi:hypothetical protein